jgi:hypothetical protein
LQQIQNPDFSAAVIEALFARMREFVREQFGNRQLEFAPMFNSLESENQRLNQRITETERNFNASVQQFNESVANVSRQFNESVANVSRQFNLQPNRSDFSETAVEDLFNRMREYVREQFGNRQLEF